MILPRSFFVQMKMGKAKGLCQNWHSPFGNVLREVLSSEVVVVDA